MDDTKVKPKPRKKLEYDMKKQLEVAIQKGKSPHKFPKCKVILRKNVDDDNGFLMLGKCIKAAKKYKVPMKDITVFSRLAEECNDNDELFSLMVHYFKVKFR